MTQIGLDRSGFAVPSSGYRMALRILAVSLLLLAAAPVAAQQASVPCAAGASADPARADVLIAASARIDEIRFERAPQARLALPGCDSVRVTERRNLPRPVQPGVTYRDVGVGIEIRSRVTVQCRLPGPFREGQGASDAARALASVCSPAPADSARRAPAAGGGP